jgi:hypothetical protein
MSLPDDRKSGTNSLIPARISHLLIVTTGVSPISALSYVRGSWSTTVNNRALVQSHATVLS